MLVRPIFNTKIKKMKTPQQRLFSIRETGKICRFNGGVKKFFQFLRDEDFLMQKGNEPYQKWIDMGLLVYVAVKIPKKNPPIVVMTPKTTIKGLGYLEKFVWDKLYKCKPCADAANN